MSDCCFLVVQNTTNLTEQPLTLYLCTGNFDCLCARYKLFSTEPKRSLVTIVSKKGYLHGDGRFWPIFPPLIEYDKHQGTLYPA